MVGNVITANFRGARTTTTSPLWQYDYGQLLRFTGVSLPDTYEVHFSNNKEFGQAKTSIGTAEGVLIPDEYLVTGRPVFAWIFLHVGEDDGETVYMAQIPVRKRSVPSDEPPTPQEQSAITQAIAALNSAVVDVQEAVDAAESARVSATNAASSATAAEASEAGVEADADRASNAATAAESAQTAAEAAQTGAETAQTGAESARDEAAAASTAQIAQINATGVAVLESIPADYTELSDSVSDLKSDLTLKSDFTNHVIAFNKNYLDSSDLNIVGKFFITDSGVIIDASAYTCGYIRFPCPGEYKLYQTVNSFGIRRLRIPLFKADKTFYKSIVATAVDDYIISFSITDEDAENAAYIGVSYKPGYDFVPMLILNGDYPSSREYTAPMYDFPDLKNMRYMGTAPINLDTLYIGGWFSNISNGTHTTLPSNFDASTGAIMVFPELFNNSFAMQMLFSPNNPIKVWARYVNMDGSYQSVWSEISSRVDKTLAVSNIPADSATVGDKIAEVKSYINNARFTDGNISLSGNYFDYENADWQVGFDTGTSISQTSGYHYAFVRLMGPGSYIRVMRNSSFGTNAARVALYDKNQRYIKMISATQIESTDGFSFELTADDAMTAVYTTINYQDTYPNVVGLFYDSDAYPLKAGMQAALPNYKPVSDPLYKCTFICDGDSICQGVVDQPKYASGWWGRIVLDYSADGKNYSVGGGTITSELYYENGNPRHWINESIDAIRSEYPTLDYLILEGGTNDADLIGRFSGDTAPAKFGTWSDTDFSGNYDNETFCGAVDMMFYKAVTYWPKAKIGFIVAMQMGTNNASSANRRRYMDEIKAIAKKWHIPVLDLWDESQMDARLTVYYDPSMTSSENVAAGKCYYDGQHPTSYGYDLMQGKIDAWIHTL